MNINVEFDEKSHTLDVPEALTSEAMDFFDKMDSDMNCAWQMSRFWVPDPDITQCCQIVADKLLTAVQKSNTEAALLMCAYILNKMPSTKRIRINTNGEIQGNEFLED